MCHTIQKTGKDLFFQILCIFLFLGFIYLFLERGEGREKERERNINVWLPLTCPLQGTRPATQPRHVPWLGIEPSTLWFAGWHSIHWATPARTNFLYLWYNGIRLHQCAPERHSWGDDIFTKEDHLDGYMYVLFSFI